MFNIFKSKPSNISIQGLGELKYYKDKTDEYWTLIENYKDLKNSIDLNFCAIEGTSIETNGSATKIMMYLINNPNKIWELVDDKFIKLAAEDIIGIRVNSVNEHFYIRSIASTSEESYEIGFHAVNIDIFLEVFVRNGIVDSIEKDYRCCDL